MKALRLVIEQNSANYRREETVENKMTYPLPPISTVIGAIHSACGYHDYKEMKISIQGQYESMHRKPYTDYCFLNSLQDDRGILVKMCNGDMLSNAFEKVASVKKPQGSSFRNHVTIQVYNQELLDEYCRLKDLNDAIDEFKKMRLAPVQALLKRRKKQLSEKKKQLDKKSYKYEQVVKREKELKEADKEIVRRLKEFQEKNYIIPISRYRSLTTSMKFYEILDRVSLMIHIDASEEVLSDILEHVYDLKSIGRSEDIVEVKRAEIVELYEESEDDEVVSENAAYIDYDMIRQNRIFFQSKDNKISGGTKYYLNRRYEIKDGKRVFDKKKVLYISKYEADEFGNGLYLDRMDGKEYIVNFL